MNLLVIILKQVRVCMCGGGLYHAILRFCYNHEYNHDRISVQQGFNNINIVENNNRIGSIFR